MLLLYILVGCSMLIFAHSSHSYPERWHPLSKCIDETATLTSNIAEIHGCWLQSTARCLKNHASDRGPFFEQQMLCGVLNPGYRLRSDSWRIKVYRQYGISVHILSFHLPSTHRCEKASLTLIDGIRLTFPIVANVNHGISAFLLIIYQ